MFIVCPNCNTGFAIATNPRVCADCKHAIGRHGKYKWIVRYGISTIVHKDCKVPDGGPGFKEK